MHKLILIITLRNNIRLTLISFINILLYTVNEFNKFFICGILLFILKLLPIDNKKIIHINLIFTSLLLYVDFLFAFSYINSNFCFIPIIFLLCIGEYKSISLIIICSEKMLFISCSLFWFNIL